MPESFRRCGLAFHSGRRSPKEHCTKQLASAQASVYRPGTRCNVWKKMKPRAQKASYTSEYRSQMGRPISYCCELASPVETRKIAPFVNAVQPSSDFPHVHYLLATCSLAP